MIWTFKNFTDEMGRDVISVAIRELPPKARAKFYERMNGFNDQPQHLWNGAVASIQYRPIGLFGPGQNEFTFLVWATEKGGKFVPKNTLSLAAERQKIINQNPERARVFNF